MRRAARKWPISAALPSSRTLDDTLWRTITPPLPQLPPLAGAVTADVAVVGGGILGLSLALHLAEEGSSVVLLEAGEIGFGASGRNTGFVVPSFVGGIGPGDVARRLGPDRAERLSRFVGGSAEVLYALVRRHAIDCAPEQTGWLQPAHTDETLRLVEERVRQWSTLGQPVALLDRSEAQRLTGSPIYRGGLIDRSGGQINPLAYVRGLARAAVAAGARIHPRSPAISYERSEGNWQIRSANGVVRAAKAVFATNALVGDLAPDVARTIIPVRPYQVATQPLDDATRQRILPNRQPVADLHRHTFAYRWSPDNRLVTGGLAIVATARAGPRIANGFLARLNRYLPDLPPLEPAFVWNGVIATTPSFLPEVWEIAPGLYAPIACNGRGVAIATAMGRALAGFLLREEGAALPVALGRPSPRAAHRLLSYGPSLWLGWNQLRDWRDDMWSERH